MAMRRGVAFNPNEVPKVGAPPSVFGIPVRVNPDLRFPAQAVGFWWNRRIEINPTFTKYPPELQMASLAHEAKHCLSMHFELRLLLTLLMFVPPLVVLPWQYIAAAAATGAVFLAALLISHKQEYDADEFAHEQGHGDGMLNVLARGTDQGKHDDFHPSHHKRILRLLKLKRQGAT